jgi:hypothetical protein
MKKIILLSAIFLISICGFSQTVINTVTATATSTHYYQPRSGTLIAGSFIFTTSSNYNGTTGTLAVFVTNDVGVDQTIKTWKPYTETSGGSPIVFSLTAGGGNENNYELRIYGLTSAWFKFVYTAGNATVGTLKGKAFFQ